MRDARALLHDSLPRRKATNRQDESNRPFDLHELGQSRLAEESDYIGRGSESGFSVASRTSYGMAIQPSVTSSGQSPVQ